MNHIDKTYRFLFKTAVSLVVLLFIMVEFAFTSANDVCINNVRKVFDEMNVKTTISNNNNKATYLKYTVTATLNQKDKSDKNIINASVYELIVLKNKARIYSREMVVFRDENVTYSILPPKKIIYVMNSVVKDDSQDVYKLMRRMQDSLFKHNEKIECKSVKQKKYNKEITVFLDGKMSSYMQMKKVIYCINDQTSDLNMVTVEYLPNFQYQKVVYEFNEQDFDYKKENFGIPAYKLVFDNNNILKKQYAGFKLIDTRKTKKNGK